MADETAVIEVHLYDGSRREVAAPGPNDCLVTMRPSWDTRFRSEFVTTNPVARRVAFRDDGSTYTVLASLKGHQDAGFMPVRLQKDQAKRVHLMLLRRDATFDFTDASWEALQTPERRDLFTFLNADPAAAMKYDALRQSQPECLSCLLNITAAIGSLPTPFLQHFKLIDLERLGAAQSTEGVKPDRFFAWVDPKIQKDIVADGSTFEKANSALHPNATSSFKETRFDEANLQFTFHENDKQTISGVECIKVEMDMDYYKDIGAHVLLEVIPNEVSRRLQIGPGLTDPRTIYAMRWMAAANRGQSYNPLYRIV